MKPIVIKEEPMSIPDVKAEIASIKKRDKELTFRGTKAEDYLAQFSDVDSKKAGELYKKIEGLKVPRLKDTHIKKIIDVLPTTANDVKVVLQGYAITVKADGLKKIAEAVNGFMPKK
jgi:DNA-directed RNA polymerase subunit F